MRTRIFSMMAVVVFAAPFVSAEEPSNVKVVYEKKTVIDLTGAVIEGELTKPEGSYIVNRKVSRFSHLIRVRENFVPELLASPDAL
jgi:hypothetical protein